LPSLSRIRTHPYLLLSREPQGEAVLRSSPTGRETKPVLVLPATPLRRGRRPSPPPLFVSYFSYEACEP
jgi:hypothetical protein